MFEAPIDRVLRTLLRKPRDCAERPQVAICAALLIACCARSKIRALAGRSDRRSRMARQCRSRAAHAPTRTSRLRVPGATAGREWRGVVDRVLCTLLQKPSLARRSDRRSRYARQCRSRAAHAPTKSLALSRRSDRRSRMARHCRSRAAHAPTENPRLHGATADREWRGIVDRVLCTLLRKPCACR